MSNYQQAVQAFHRALGDFDRYEKGTYGHRTAIGDIVRAVDALVLARIKEILVDKSMDELEALARELQTNSAEPVDKSV